MLSYFVKVNWKICVIREALLEIGFISSAVEVFKDEKEGDEKIIVCLFLCNLFI